MVHDDSRAVLNQCRLLDVLEKSDRPAFVLPYQELSTFNDNGLPDTAWCNLAYRSVPGPISNPLKGWLGSIVRKFPEKRKFVLCTNQILWTNQCITDEFILFTGLYLGNKGLRQLCLTQWGSDTSTDDDEQRTNDLAGEIGARINWKRGCDADGMFVTEEEKDVGATGAFLQLTQSNVEQLEAKPRGSSIRLSSQEMNNDTEFVSTWARDIDEDEATASKSNGSPSEKSESTLMPKASRKLQKRTSSFDIAATTFIRTPACEYDMYDWTRLPATAKLPEHIQLVRDVNWKNTSIGEIDFWPQSLRTLCSLLTSFPTPVAAYFGSDFTIVYNEAYQEVAGYKHPQMLGTSFSKIWPELWEGLKDLFQSVYTSGQASLRKDDRLFLDRHGFLEETYFTWSLIPLFGEDGTIFGLLNPAFELTQRVIAERRMLTMRRVGEQTANATSVKDFWAKFLSALNVNQLDTPLAMMYSRRGDISERSESSRSSGFDYSLDLECSLGVPTGHICAPESIDLRTEDSPLAPALRAAQSKEFLLLDVDKGLLPKGLFKNVEWRGFGEPCKHIVICPIHAHSKDESVSGFFILGINPRRPFDDDYILFCQLLTRQLSTSLATMLLFEGEVKRNEQSQKIAAMEKVSLSEELARRTWEAQDYEHRFTRLAEVAPVGIYIADPNGAITFTNDMWFEITQHPKSSHPSDWRQSILPEDIAIANGVWDDVAKDIRMEPPTVECRWKEPYQSTYGLIDRWTLGSMKIVYENDGRVSSIFGCLTDISELKYAESEQRRRLAEAAELKRQQDNFVDMASHEMRNPLSAILQCADTIITAVKEENSQKQHFLDAIDAAQTILLCASHQKRVVDDILTMSKLDSRRLMITPVDVRPEKIVEEAIKIFQQEITNYDIKLSFKIDDSYSKLQVTHVKLDPTRLLQVLINLVTNALKFIRGEKQRRVQVTTGASATRPIDHTGMVFFRSHSMEQGFRALPQDALLPVDGEEKDVLYLTFEVSDTGKGLTEDEVKLLFQRFNQATPKTHVQYGGSGLGLFICRELVHLQQGEIGVRSEAGKGSSFSFYIKCHRSTLPEVPQTDAKPLPNLQDTAVKSIPKAVKPEPVKLAGLKILIVEDNVINQTLVHRQLTKLKHATRVANHGLEALEILQSGTFHPNVVLMDVEMPIMDGLTATRKIREGELEEGLGRHLMIVAVTANARPEQVREMFEAGVDDVLSKPFRIPELEEKLKVVLGREQKELALKKSRTM